MSFQAFQQRISTLKDNLGKVSNGMAQMTGAFGKLDAASRGTEGGLGGLHDSLKAVGSAVKTSTDGMEGLIGSVPILGQGFSFVAGAANTINSTFLAVTGAAKDLAENMSKAMDVPKEYMEFDKSMLKINQRFAGTIGEAKGFGDALRQIPASDFGQAMYLSTDELKNAAEAFSKTGLTMQDMGQTVDTVIGQTNTLTAAMTLGSAAGLDNAETGNILNSLMKKQAMSGQEAIEMMASYSSMSQDLGLSMKSIADSLNQVATSFMTLGMNARFGEPILRGFGDVVQRIGLPIESATNLSAKLSTSLGNLAGDYAKAFLVMDSGGIDLGQGGGMLGAGIALQAAMRNSENQAQLGGQLAGGMRSMLERFGGGEITTLDMAQDDPTRASQLYTQQQLLGQQFGITNVGDQNAVLDLLAQLDDATQAGDQNRANELQEQLQRAVQNKDETITQLEKIEQRADAQIAAIIGQSRLLAEFLRQRGNDFIERVKMDEGFRDAGAEVSPIMEMMEQNLLRLFPEDAAARSNIAASFGSAPGAQNAEDFLANAVLSGRGDMQGMRGAAADIQPELEAARTMPLDQLAANIEQAAANAAASASTAAIREGGFVNREEFAAAIATQIATAMAQVRVPVNLQLTGEAEEIFTEVAAQMKKLRDGTD